MRVNDSDKNYLNYIPIVSTVTNSVDLFKKYQMDKNVAANNKDILQIKSYEHLQNKSKTRCLIGLIPVIGNIIIYVMDQKKTHKEHQKEEKYQQVLETVDSGKLLPNEDSHHYEDKQIAQKALLANPLSLNRIPVDLVSQLLNNNSTLIDWTKIDTNMFFSFSPEVQEVLVRIKPEAVIKYAELDFFEKYPQYILKHMEKIAEKDLDSLMNKLPKKFQNLNKEQFEKLPKNLQYQHINKYPKKANFINPQEKSAFYKNIKESALLEIIKKDPLEILNLEEKVAISLIRNNRKAFSEMDKDIFARLPVNIKKTLAAREPRFLELCALKEYDNLSKEAFTLNKDAFKSINFEELKEKNNQDLVEKELQKQVSFANIEMDKQELLRLSQLNKKEASEELSKNPEHFPYLSNILKNDLQIIKLVIDKEPRLIKYASPAAIDRLFREDFRKKLALLQYTSDTFQLDYLKIAPNLLEFASSGIQLTLLKDHPKRFAEISIEVQFSILKKEPEKLEFANEEVALFLIQEDPANLKYASREIVKKVLEQNGLLFKYVSDSLKKDEKLIKIALEQNYLAKFLLTESEFEDIKGSLDPYRFYEKYRRDFCDPFLN